VVHKVGHTKPKRLRDRCYLEVERSIEARFRAIHDKAASIGVPNKKVKCALYPPPPPPLLLASP
jgi:hypothetical protein